MNVIKTTVSKEPGKFVEKMFKNKVVRENLMLLKKNWNRLKESGQCAGNWKKIREIQVKMQEKYQYRI